ncbi:MAG: SOS response-associated peptidase family protein [Stenotrophomonas sp.]
MCFSAEAWQDYRAYVEKFCADISIKDFVILYGDRAGGAKIKIPKGMDAAFAWPKSPAEQEIHDLIQQFNASQVTALEQDLFKQSKRLADAERSLQTKETVKAREDVRIATNKIAAGKAKLADIKRPELKPRDERIFPGTYGLVLVSEGGQRVIRPMRYQCRPAGKPAAYDRKYPGTYNARRDNLEGFWKGQFGRTHGLMVVNTFYENVEGPEGGNQVLQFTPRTGELMLVACLWSHWKDPAGVEPDLLSFAAITDEPEPEVAAAGHDRTIINIKPEHVDAWLNPDPGDLQSLYGIFDDKRHPYYEHRLAA